MGSLDYFALTKEEAVDVILKTNKRIVKIVVEDEYQGNGYKETSHTIKVAQLVSVIFKENNLR